MALVKRGNIWWIDIYHNGKRRRFSTKTSNKKKAEEIYTKVLLKLNNSYSRVQPEVKPEQSLSLSLALSCEVTRVLDGDTFHCLPEKPPIGIKLHKNGTITVRMPGIDAPEKRQAFGEDARESLKAMIGGKVVKLDIKDIDRYGRTVAYVWLGKVNINLEQVKKGMAWAYAEYLDRPYASEFYETEKQARKQKLGLWQQSNPTPPWEWRKRNR